MADKTKIEWSDATWNVITGCSPVSPGCANCYAAQLAGTRLKHHPSRKGLTKEVNGRPVWTGEVRFNEEWLTLPLRWKKPRRIFVCAHGDIFHSNVPDGWLDKIFAVMVLASQHTFQVLTKRPDRMRSYIKSITQGRRDALIARAVFDVTGSVHAAFSVGLLLRRQVIDNVWLGVTAENQEQANKRIPLLLQTPAAKRFVSIEPILSEVNLRRLHPENFAYDLDSLDQENNQDTYYEQVALDWVICGGESGPNARPMHPDWVRSLRDQCQEAGTPFFFKQWGEWIPYPQMQEQDKRDAEMSAPGYLMGVKGGTPTKLDIDCFWREGICEFFRVGKKAAGRLLDGREYQEMPV